MQAARFVLMIACTLLGGQALFGDAHLDPQPEKEGTLDLVGPPGAGHTTTCAGTACRCKRQQCVLAPHAGASGLQGTTCAGTACRCKRCAHLQLRTRERPIVLHFQQHIGVQQDQVCIVGEGLDAGLWAQARGNAEVGWGGVLLGGVEGGSGSQSAHSHRRRV